MAATMPIQGFKTPVLRVWTPALVNTATDKPEAFAEYIHQTLGIPWPTRQDMVILRKKISDFFVLYPTLDYSTLCRVVVFLRNRKRRVPRMWMVVDEFRKAWAAGQLPELEAHNRVDERITEKIMVALEVETDPVWRRRLLLAQGASQQQEVYDAWSLMSSDCK